MASRIEEKKKRREEREAQEAAARSAQKRQRTMQIAGAALLLIVAVGAIAYFALSGGSSSSSGNPDATAAGPQAPTDPIAQIPAIRNTDLTSAAKAAGCVVSHPPSEGREHVTGTVRYKTNPPTSGNHNQVPSLDGVYPPGGSPTPEHYVHTLEHGRIELQYRPGTSRKVRLQLQSLLAESYDSHPGGYKMLLFENNTNMPYAVAATAWTQMITCKTVNDKTWDALRAFRNMYVDKAPEGPSQPPNNL